MSGGDARAELGVRPLLGVSGYWMAQLDPRRSCGKDTGVRGSPGSPAVRKMRWWRCLPAAWGLCSDSGNPGGAA